MRRVLCILIVLFVLAPTIALAQAYRCHGTGETHARCCCPEADEAPEPGAPAMSPPCCCDLIAAVAPTDQHRSAATPSHPHLGAPPLLLPETPLLATPPAAVALAPTARSGAPPAPTAPVFLRTCSLLL